LFPLSQGAVATAEVELEFSKTVIECFSPAKMIEGNGRLPRSLGRLAGPDLLFPFAQLRRGQPRPMERGKRGAILEIDSDGAEKDPGATAAAKVKDVGQVCAEVLINPRHEWVFEPHLVVEEH